MLYIGYNENCIQFTFSEIHVLSITLMLLSTVLKVEFHFNASSLAPGEKMVLLGNLGEQVPDLKGIRLPFPLQLPR